MSNEEKQYSIIGKVEIGTDEYRDLIEKNVQLEHDYRKLRNESWEKEKECDRHKTITISQKEQLEDLKSFLKAENLEDRYQLYLLKEAQKKQQEDEE